MTAVEGGFLASRVLSVVLMVRAILLVPVWMSTSAFAHDTTMRTMLELLAPWAYIACILVLALGAAVLWYKAEILARIFARPEGSEPAPRQVNLMTLGLRLLGLYLVLDNLPSLLAKLSYTLDERASGQETWLSESSVSLYGSIAVTLIGMYLFWFQGGVGRAANYVFNYGRPMPGEREPNE